VGPDDVVEVVERRNVAAQEHAASQQSLESDGSGGDEPDENEPDVNEPSSGGDGGSDGDQDAPGEGSNGEDAHDNSSDGSSSDSSSSSDGGDSSDGSSDGGDSSDGSSDGGDSSDGSSDGGGNSDGSDAPAIPDPGSYPGDSAAPADLARWMGAAAQKRGLPAELPVMAALTESGMRNLNYGDADSVGFFQMRVGVWNNGAYAGYPQNPQKQLDWFLDHAQAVGAQRRARGLPVDDPKQYGDWVADVERPAAQYRGRYQLNYDRAHHLLDTPAPARHHGADGVDAAAAGDLLPGPRAVAALAEARRYIGTPYHWGGASPSTGFDCSGLVQWAYAKVGIHIPRVTDQQILAGTPVDRKSLMPGDLVFFRDSTGYVHHVGMSLGGDKFVNAPHTGADVRINSLKEPYFAQQFTGGRRFDRAVAAAHRVSADARFLPAVKRSQLPER
jgi:cell wall-associated NlpC family hydrolase